MHLVTAAIVCRRGPFGRWRSGVRARREDRIPQGKSRLDVISVWSIKDMDQQMDFNLIGAMVTPSDPAVEGLIRAAANYDPSHSMESGYKSDLDKDGSVYQRLADLWKAEADDYNLTYISTTISFAPGQSQRIRLPAEVLDQASGNCIEQERPHHSDRPPLRHVPG